MRSRNGKLSAIRWLLTLSLLYWPATGSTEPEATGVPVVEAPVDPVVSAVREILETAQHPRLRWARIADVRSELDRFYGQRGYRPAWIRDDGVLPVVEPLLSILAKADDQGLDPSDYDARALADWLPAIRQTKDPRERALFDTALTVSVARYAFALNQGRVDPRRLGYRFKSELQQPLDIPPLLSRLIEVGDPAPLLSELEPRSHLYRLFKNGLQQYRALAATDTDRNIKLPSKLNPGERSTEVPRLRAVLNASGEPTPDPVPADAELYDPALAEAVKRFQRRHGLIPDGVVGKGTQERLSLTNAARLEQLRLGLERARWLPDDAAGPQLLVNVPSFRLFAFKDGLDGAEPPLSIKVIVGQSIEGRKTPIFNADMTYVVFRPHWNLPYKIATREMLPGALRSSGYLARHNIEVVSGFGANAAVYAPTRENLQRVASGALKLRQKPGPRNALGLVKFAFPNDDSVYLHSTPSQGLFERDRRDFSHGCIRVADPVGLAEWVLRTESDWSRERIVRAMAGGRPTTVVLPRPLPVYIFYSTVWEDEDGQLVFLADIYNQDRELKSLLEKEFPQQRDRLPPVPDNSVQADPASPASGALPESRSLGLVERQNDIPQGAEAAGDLRKGGL